MLLKSDQCQHFGKTHDFVAFKPIGKQKQGYKRKTRQICRARHDEQEEVCRQVAELAVNAFVESDTSVGISHGKMGIYVLEKLADRLQAGLLKNIQCVTSSEVASVEAAVHGIPLQDLRDPQTQVSTSFVEADELDHSGSSIQFITGRAELSSDGESFQQPQLTQLRKLIQKSSSVIALASSEDKLTSRLGGTLPVVISSEEWEETAEAIDDLFIGDAEVWRRSREPSANPRGGNHPYMSPEGHSIIDIKFISSLKLDGENVPYQEIADEIGKIAGVKTLGLFLDVTKAAVAPRGSEAKIIEKGLILGFRPDGQ